MPFEDWMSALGVGAFVLLILVPFWKLDDALSEQARVDIADYLLSQPYRLAIDAQQLMNSVADGIFGRSLRNGRAIIVRMAISFVFFIFLYVIFLFN